MVDTRLYVFASGLLFLTPQAYGQKWLAPFQDPLRLNIAVVKSRDARNLAGRDGQREEKPAIVDSLPSLGFSELHEPPPTIIPFSLSEKNLMVEWKAADAAPDRFTRPEFNGVHETPVCNIASDKVVTTRAEAWEVAYKCLRDLANARNSKTNEFLIQEFLGREPSAIYAVEPVLDLVPWSWNDKVEDDSSGGNATVGSLKPVVGLPADPPSPVWPSGEPSWHLGSEYSQLNDAYKAVFPRGIDTPGNVWIAHLDTGFLSSDPALPKYHDQKRSKNCKKDGPCTTEGAEASWGDRWPRSPGHGAATLSSLAGQAVVDPNTGQRMGANPSARVFSIKVNKTFVHLDSRRMAAGIDEAIRQEADLITLSHGGLPSIRLSSSVSDAYYSGTPIFAATGDFLAFPLFLGQTFRSVVYPARYNLVMGVAGVTENDESYGDNPGYKWWFKFGDNYFANLKSWMARGNFGPSTAMNNVVSAYSPNITRSNPTSSEVFVVGHDGGGTSHSTPQVAAAASLWLEKNKPLFDGNSWRSWEKSEAVYQALAESAYRCFASYDTEHFGQGILRAKNALEWTYKPKGQLVSSSGNVQKLTRRERADLLDLLGVVELLKSVRLPGQFQENVADAFSRALAMELAQLVFTSDELQLYLQTRRLCKPTSGCDRCSLGELSKTHLSKNELWRLTLLVTEAADASETLKDALWEVARKQTD